MTSEIFIKVSLFALLNLQGISEERAAKETDALIQSLREIKLEVLSMKYSESAFPSFRKLAALSSQSGTEYFFWGTLRQSGENSYMNLYLYDVSGKRKVKAIL